MQPTHIQKTYAVYTYKKHMQPTHIQKTYAAYTYTKNVARIRGSSIFVPLVLGVDKVKDLHMYNTYYRPREATFIWLVAYPGSDFAPCSLGAENKYLVRGE